ncbi:helicase-related protein [Evansella sp. AB-rgal1]|uniref:helicase-related protein n=1 Tax=Evansella sp. AB-rgal1 TaxID=3242696 RepID=UPI00359DE17D
MSKLAEIYPKALEQTKQKVMDDVVNYLGNKETLPSYSNYLMDRKEYIDQIWTNIWINKATNDISKKEKKVYLTDLGLDIEHISRKELNTLFRNEMRFYNPFSVKDWLDERFLQDEKKWQELYEKARVSYLKKEGEEKRENEKRIVYEKIFQFVEQQLDNNYLDYYVNVRKRIADQLSRDIQNEKYDIEYSEKYGDKLKQIGRFHSDDYKLFSDFSYELTGNVYKTMYWEYETYEDVYNQILISYLEEEISEILFQQLPDNIIKEYMSVFQEAITFPLFHEYAQELLYETERNLKSNLFDEYIVHLLKLSELRFDTIVHKQQYNEDINDRQKIEVEHELQVIRKKEAEIRMLEDIFGREYSLPLGRNIKYVLHIGETNTGKTHNALQSMMNAKSGMYLAPLRLLALEVYDKLNEENIPCSLKTGEEEKEAEGAHHISCTVEMFYEKEFYDVIVIDEAQMISDKDRGYSWYKAITKAKANEVHIIGSKNVKEMILQLLGDSEVIIHEYSRDIPLKVERKEFNIKQTKKGDALVCFSRKKVLETASSLENNGHRVSMIYGSMPPETRKKQIQRFTSGETNVIVSTDAIGMGLNLPIQRIVFLENQKFDGNRRRRLTSQEVKQIAGRAGRQGIYNIGKVAFTSDIKLMRDLLQQEDRQIYIFAIAPTNAIFERFQKYYRDLGTFFELWDKFESPKGTKKASLAEERELYDVIKGTEIEVRFSMMDLYGFLHLPFSKKEPKLIEQWESTMYAIVRRVEFPEPFIQSKNLEDLELSYRSIGLHLLFLYRLDRRTEAIYWERIREEISDGVHEFLQTEVKKMTKKCRHCGKKLAIHFAFAICDRCHIAKNRRSRDMYQ